jgi:hypothetical protein
VDRERVGQEEKHNDCPQKGGILRVGAGKGAVGHRLARATHFTTVFTTTCEALIVVKHKYEGPGRDIIITV